MIIRGTWVARHVGTRTVATLALVIVGCSDSGGSATDGGLDTAAIVDGAPDAPAPCPASKVVDLATAAELTIGGDTGSTLGIFDPSIVYPPGASAGALAYSSVPTQETIQTRIAVSADHGATWFVADANAPESATISSSDATGTSFDDQI